MKIKHIPDDFVVDEVTDVEPGQTGRYSIYLLRKRGWNTSDAIRRIVRDFSIPEHAVSYGGKKDRRALTSQLISIEDCDDDLTFAVRDGSFSLFFLGRLSRPMGPDLIRGNRFSVVVRDLGIGDIDKACTISECVQKDGMPNYYDDQRFGSYRAERGFLAEKIIRKHYNGALKIYLTLPDSDDREEERKRKNRLHDLWGDWKACLGLSATAFEHNAFSYLMRNPKGFIPVLQQIPREEMSLYFSAYQSFLWNSVLRKCILSFGEGPFMTIKGTAGDYLFPGALTGNSPPDLRTLMIPTPSADMPRREGVFGHAYAETFQENSITAAKFNVRSIRQAYMKSIERNAFVRPLSFTMDSSDDEIFPGKRKCTASFILPRGSYGTMLIKRLFCGTIGQQTEEGKT